MSNWFLGVGVALCIDGPAGAGVVVAGGFVVVGEAGLVVVGDGGVAAVAGGLEASAVEGTEEEEPGWVVAGSFAAGWEDSDPASGGPASADPLPVASLAG